MSTAVLLLVAVMMLVGLAGIIIPVLPGLALIWAGVLVWSLASDGGAARWVVLAVATVLLVVGTVVKYALPARTVAGSGAPRRSMLLAVGGACVGFVVIPVVGLVVGGLVGLLLAEYQRLRDWPAAWSSTRAALVSVGIGVLVELAAGVLTVLAWGVGVLAS